ncbi:MAG: ribosome silencing factor [bacterium]
MMTPAELAEGIVGILEAKLGEDIVAINLSGQTALADYFVIATAGSSVHARSLAEAVVAGMKERGERVKHVEGLEHGQWALLDYVDVIVHIFSGEARQFYGLERLWGDLPTARRGGATPSPKMP